MFMTAKIKVCHLLTRLVDQFKYGTSVFWYHICEGPIIKYGS